MSIFDDANDAIFESELAIDAVYRSLAGIDTPVRVIASSEDMDIGMGAARVRAAAHIFDVRVSELNAERGGLLIVTAPARFVGTYRLEEPPKISGADRSIARLSCVRVA